MKAMILNKICDLTTNRQPLTLAELPVPSPSPNEILIKIRVCGVCHTELDEIEGRTPPPHLPVVLGHQVIGVIADIGAQVTRLNIGDRVGVAWIFSACGQCDYCLTHRENLCPDFKATGRDVHGGYAEYMTVPEPYAYPIPSTFSDEEAAPLLCAGAIGYRSLQLSLLQNGQTLGLTGFGASAHLVLQMARYQFPQSKIFVFARSKQEQDFALQLGASWAGDTDEDPPEGLDCIIDTTPVWKPVLKALKNLKPGGRLVINAIRKEETDQSYLTNLQYPEHLWLEKEVKSVANITRRDVKEFLLLAAQIPLKPEVQTYPLPHANQALMEMKERKIRGAKVLVM